jgi:hypothetical protein
LTDLEKPPTGLPCSFAAPRTTPSNSDRGPAVHSHRPIRNAGTRPCLPASTLRISRPTRGTDTEHASLVEQTVTMQGSLAARLAASLASAFFMSSPGACVSRGDVELHAGIPSAEASAPQDARYNWPDSSGHVQSDGTPTSNPECYTFASGEGCSPSETCVEQNAPRYGVCVPQGSGEEGHPCDSSDGSGCISGLLCVKGVCRRGCTLYDDSLPCPGGDLYECIESGFFIGGCIPTCKSCPPSSYCFNNWDPESGLFRQQDAPTAYCMPSAGNLLEGEECALPSPGSIGDPCAPGLACTPNASTSSARCRRPCNPFVDDQRECPDGRVCRFSTPHACVPPDLPEVMGDMCPRERSEAVCADGTLCLASLDAPSYPPVCRPLCTRPTMDCPSEMVYCVLHDDWIYGACED